MKIPAVMMFCFGLACPALAMEAPPASVVGTEGLDPVPFHAMNRSGRPIECQAAIAHWYSQPIGTVADGASLSAELWSNPADGTVYLLNAGRERMPVQALWCGIAGAAASTRADIRLERRAGRTEPAIDLDCDGIRGDGRLACRAANLP